MRSLRLAVLFSALLGAGCNTFGTRDPSEEARVRLQGTSEVDLQLVTSIEFGYTVDEEGNRQTVLIKADTALVRPPYDEVFDISSRGIFLLRLSNANQQTADVTLEVSIDGSRKVSQELIIGADEEGNPGTFEWAWLN